MFLRTIECTEDRVGQQTQNVTVDQLDDLFTVDITECDQPSSCTNSPQKHNSVCDESLSFSDIVDLTGML